MSPDEYADMIIIRNIGPDRTFRPFTDESEDASGDNIVYADESEWMDDYDYGNN